MAGYFDRTYFDPAYFDTDAAALTGFIPRGSMADVLQPDLPVAAVVAPDRPTVLTVIPPSLPQAEVE